MNAPFHPDATSLDRLKVGTKARVSAVDWTALDESEACRPSPQRLTPRRRLPGSDGCSAMGAVSPSATPDAKMSRIRPGSSVDRAAAS